MRKMLKKPTPGPHAYHQVIYAGLSACHGFGCLLTEKPLLYGPMALLYLLLAAIG